MNTALLLYKYAGRILPEAEKLSGEISAMLETENGDRGQSRSAAHTNGENLDLRCLSLFALYPGLDVKNSLSFITSLYGLADYLDDLRRQTRVRDEAYVRKLYPALQDAVDPERTTFSYQSCYSLNAGKQLKRLVDRCRLEITALPSYKLVTGKMKKYVQLYIDLQAYRYLPDPMRQEYIEAWADCYLKRYRDISCWEFSAAAGSLMGICSMFAAASDPHLSPEDVRALDEAFFPWICGLHKLLDAYVSAGETLSAEQMNFTSRYDNLKICEARLNYFSDRASTLCARLKNPEFHLFLLKSLISLYLSDSRAFFGMYRLSSRNIIRSSPVPTELYWKTCKLLRRISVL